MWVMFAGLSKMGQQSRYRDDASLCSPQGADPPPSSYKRKENRQAEIIWTCKIPSASRWIGDAILPNHIKFMSSSALAPIWSTTISESGELTQGSSVSIITLRCSLAESIPGLLKRLQIWARFSLENFDPIQILRTATGLVEYRHSRKALKYIFIWLNGNLPVLICAAES